MRSSDRPASAGGRLRAALMRLMRGVSPRMAHVNAVVTAAAVMLAVCALLLMNQVLDARTETDRVRDAYDVCRQAADDLMETSDLLTKLARQYVSTRDVTYLDGYLDEVDELDHRGKALDTLREHASSASAVVALEKADDYSDELAQVELLALRLVADVDGLERGSSSLGWVEVPPEVRHLHDREKLEEADRLVNGDGYDELKGRIVEQVNLCSTLLVDTLGDDLAGATEKLQRYISAMRVTVLLLALTVVASTVATRLLLLWPMSMHEKAIRADDRLIPGGAAELRTLTDAYNEIFDANHFREESLSYEANHDALTGVYNRGAFDSLLTVHKHGCALVLVDVDNFKHFNDDYGHDMGDAVLVEVAAVLFDSFRSSDHICRIGGDEFAVICEGMDPTLEAVIAAKIEGVRDFLRDTSNGLPSVTVSVGVAFGWHGCGDNELFQLADQALYGGKESGRDGYAFATRA